MNLHDLIPLEQTVAAKTDSRLPIASTAVRMKEQRALRSLIDDRGVDRSRDTNEALTRFNKSLTKTIEDDRVHIFQKIGTLPDELLVDDDPISELSRSPRMSLDEVRNLADVFGFLIIPFEYLDQRALATSTERRAAQGFAEALDVVDAVPYVLCPVPYYSVERHVLATDDLPLYAGVFQQAFMAVTLSIPVFRQLSRRLSKVEAQQNTTTARLDSVEIELKNLARRLQEIHDAEERRQIALVQQQAALERQLERQRAFIPYDPLLIGLPSGASITDIAVSVIVGPCWGPDFEPIVASSRGLKKIAGQRSQIDKAARWAKTA